MYMKHIITLLDSNKYHLEIMDLLDEGKRMYFSEIYTNWHICCHTNNDYYIIFYESNIEPLMVEFIDMCKEINGNVGLISYECPMCGAP